MLRPLVPASAFLRCPLRRARQAARLPLRPAPGPPPSRLPLCAAAAARLTLVRGAACGGGRVPEPRPAPSARGARPPSKIAALARAAFSRRLASASGGTEAVAAAAPPAAPPAASPAAPPAATRPAVGYWLAWNAALVFGIVVLGGLTRLTESGLSIVEWKPLTGVLPPLTQRDWEEEFEKYKQFPEYKMLNKDMVLPEFKSIFYMEWGHRIWGRVIGLAFLIPAAYYIRKGYMTAGVKNAVYAMGGLICFQGALGWYMVKSGLEDSIIENKQVPRVSQYRLAAHLGAAFVLYSAMALTALHVLRRAQPLSQAAKALSGSDRVRKYRNLAHFAAGLIFVTALSGAFVAGLDAGFLYNEFPLMGGRVVPAEIWSDDYAASKTEDGRAAGLWRNIFENPTTVQFNHRMLAITTAVTVAALFVASRSVPLAPSSRLATNLLAATAAGQVTLGILTLLHGVPIPLAAAHQAGSLTLLTMALWLLHELKRVPK